MSWQWVQYTPSTASTQDCLSSLHSHHYELTPEWSFSFRRASLYDRPPSASSPWELKGKVTLPHSHGCELTNWWKESQHPAHRAPSVHCLPVLIQTRSMLASKLAQCWPPSVSPNSLDYGLQTRSILASKCISKVARLQPPSSHDHSLQVHLHTRLITASKCVSKLARSQPPSASPNSLNHGLQVHLAQSQPSSVSLYLPDYELQVCTIMASKGISNLARLQPWSVSLSSLNRHLEAHLELLKHRPQPVEIYCV